MAHIAPTFKSVCHAPHHPDAGQSFPLDSGMLNRVVVEVWECGAIGCRWHSDSAPTESPRVDVCDQWNGYTMVFTHSRGDTFRVDVDYANAVWATSCAQFQQHKIA